jgi:hypothetical protein
VHSQDIFVALKESLQFFDFIGRLEDTASDTQLKRAGLYSDSL